MFNHALLIAISLVAFVLPVQPQVPNPEAQKWREDLAVMAREMEVTHKNLYHKVTPEQFAAAVRALDQRIPQLQRHQIIVEMMKIVAMVGDGHSNIYPNRDAKIAFRSLPIQLYLFSDGMFIRAAQKEHAGLVGARVLKIGPATVDEAISRVRPLIGRDSEMGVKFFASYLLAIPEVLHALELSDSVDSAEFTIERSGKRETVVLKPSGPVDMMQADTDTSWMPRDGWVSMRAPGSTPLWLRDAKNLFWFEYLPDSKTVYTQINQVGNKPDESLAAFAQRLTAYVDSNPVERLVIDMRINRGGNGELLRPLEIALVKSKIDRPGKLFILIGRSTWSASQFFINWMEKYSNAIFVGEPSGSRGNHYGDSRRITLPNSGVTVRVSVYYWQEWPPWDMRQQFGTQIAAELSSTDYRNNFDPALAAAIAYEYRKSLYTILEEALSTGGIDLATKRFREFKLDPVNKFTDVEQTLLEIGQKLYNEKKFGDALELFKLDIAENPHSFRGYFAAGIAYYNLGKKDLALASLNKALELNPKSYDVANFLRNLKR